MSKKLNLALIGAGQIGKLHAATILFRVLEATLAAITDVQCEMAEAVTQRCAIPRVAAGANDKSQDPSIDAVLICSPRSVDADLVVDSVRASKHVFFEKPMDHSIEKIDCVLRDVKKPVESYKLGTNRKLLRELRRDQHIGIGPARSAAELVC